MSTGEILRGLRGEKTIRETAEKIGVSPSALTMYENDNRTPRDEVKIKISEYYRVPVQDIFFASIVHK